MTKLLRALASLLLAFAIASVSFAASAHSTVIADTGYAQTLADELPCSDCGAHRLRVCAQSCAASLEPTEVETPGLARRVAAIAFLRDGQLLSGIASKPPIVPPIA